MLDSPPTPTAEVTAYLSSLPELPPVWEPPLDARRRECATQVHQDSGVPQPIESVTEVNAAGVSARLYRPGSSSEGLLVWLHGGGWVLGDVASFDPLARALANGAGCAVLSVDYRLAPEHPFPAALEDSWAALQWATSYFSKIAVGGDSAGGNLAAVTALRARDSGLKLALQLLVYPVLEYGIDSAAYRAFASRYDGFAGCEGYGSEFHSMMRWMWEQYVPDRALRVDPQAAPIRADSLGGLPPTLVLTAEHDIFRQENEAYAQRLIEQGVQADILAYPGQIHGFFHLIGRLEDSRRAVAQSAKALRAALLR